MWVTHQSMFYLSQHGRHLHFRQQQRRLRPTTTSRRHHHRLLLPNGNIRGLLRLGLGEAADFGVEAREGGPDGGGAEMTLIELPPA